MSASEKTSLLPSSASGSGNSYYFLKGDRDPNVGKNDMDGGEVIESVPEGAIVEDFASRPIGQRPQPSNRSMAPPSEPNFFQKLFGGALGSAKHTANIASNNGTNSNAPNARTYGDIGTLPRERKVPIKVEPKVFFANERTFLAWLHSSVLLAGASVAIVAFADSTNPWSQLYGVILLPVAISFICYSMYQYARRAAMIRRKDPGPYEDTVGPTVLAVMLMLSILAQFAIKVYSMM